jgi:hypothetical protein
MATERESQLLAIVRRSNAETYRTLLQKFGDEVMVIWDRRAAERRMAPEPAEPERRRGERRGPTRQIWGLGFLIVPTTSGRGRVDTGEVPV